jgi:hypothetical protein
MVTTPSPKTFPNKSPVGKPIQTEDVTLLAPAAGTCIGNQLSFQTVFSESVTVNHAKNKLKLYGQARFNLSSSNAMEVRIRRDGDDSDIIASLTTGIQTNGTWTLQVILTDEDVGAHTYDWQIKNTNNPGENSCVTNTASYKILSEVDDKSSSIIHG